VLRETNLLKTFSDRFKPFTQIAVLAKTTQLLHKGIEFPTAQRCFFLASS